MNKNNNHDLPNRRNIRSRPNNQRNKKGIKKKPRKKNKNSRIVLYIGGIIILFILILIIKNCTSKKIENPNKSETTSSAETETAIITDDSPVLKLGDEIYSTNAIFYNLTTNTTVCEKNADEIIFPASLTKIMTVVIAIENIPPSKYYDEIILTQDIFDYVFLNNAAVAGYKPGEEIIIYDMFYATLLPSGAETAIGLARYISGSEAEYVKLMNEKAKEIGCENTNFINVTGLHDVNHFSTARDMMLILKYALKNDLFKRIFTSETYTTEPTNLTPNGFTFVNTAFKALKENEYKGSYITGGKTGFTTEARLCLATSATKNNAEFILLTFGAGDGDNKTAYHVMDALKIYENYT